MLGISICEGRFAFGKKIGAGSFGSVYYGLDTKENVEVAIKVESASVKTPQLQYESKLYQVLGAGRGFPSMYWFGQESGCNILVLDLMGPSLQDLFNFIGSGFSLSTVLQIGHQIFDIIEYVHSCNFIHRDLKPANILIGRHERATELQLIDFGLAKRYFSHKTSQHIPYRKKQSSGVIGSARYASINAHDGIELSRRDDMESIAYMLIYFMRGSLPWQYLDPPPPTREQKNARIGQMKSSCKFEQLCEGLPSVYATILMMAQCLDFEEAPNYRLIHSFFEKTAERAQVDCSGGFEWTVPLRKGAVVEHVEDTDRLSCNLSQGSIDSLGENARMQARPARGSSSKEPAGRVGQGTPSTRPGQGQAAQVGPLLRVAYAGKGSFSDASDDQHSVSIVRAMQTAGVPVETLRKLGVGHADKVAGVPAESGGGQTSMEPVEQGDGADGPHFSAQVSGESSDEEGAAKADPDNLAL